MEQLSESYDVIIVGGSYAGLSAAMALGRARRKVLIVDAGQPCNAQTPYSHNFITQDGKPPAEIAAEAKVQVMEYPTVDFTSDLVTSATRMNDMLLISTQLGKTFRSRKLILATGIKDIPPAIEGFRECWGISILHCPYCHGYEVRDLKIGIFANADVAVELTKLIYNWSQNLVVVTNGPAAFSEAQHAQLRTFNVPIVELPVNAVVHREGDIEKLLFEDGQSLNLSAMFTRLPFAHHTPVANQLGCEFTDAGLLKADDMGKTNVPDLYVAGDCCLPQRSVSIAVASGMRAAAAINRELIESGFFASAVKEIVI